MPACGCFGSDSSAANPVRPCEPCGLIHAGMGDKALRVMELPASVVQLGDPRGKQATWTLMPVDTSDGKCSQCAVLHEPDQPHNNESLAFQYAFYAEHDRWPTWADAMAHCTPETQDMWKTALRELGVDV